MNAIATSEHIQRIEEARHRLEALHADTQPEETRGYITKQERAAIRAILNELHRLNLAVSEQRKTLKSIATRKNKSSRKPSAARSTQPTAHRTRQNKEQRRT